MSEGYEVLAELCDRATQLACRLHVVTETFNNPALLPEVLFDSKIERAREQICRKYNVVIDPETLASKKHLEPFKTRAPKIVNCLAKPFALFIDMLKFRDDAKTVLNDTIRNSVDFKFGTNTDLTTKLLGLVTKYVKLHLLLDPRFQKQEEKSIGPQDIVILYQTALKCQKGTRDTDSNKLKSYLELFCENNCLRTVKDDLNPVAEMVGVYLLRLSETLQQLMNVETSTQQIVSSGAFSLIDRLERLGMPVDTVENYRAGGGLQQEEDTPQGTKRMKNYYGSAKFFLDIAHLAEMKEWIFFGIVACPNVLGGRDGEQAIELLKLVSSDGWRCRVFRDKIVDMHELWEEHFKFLKKTTNKYHGKAKDHLHYIEKGAMRDAGRFHAIRRSFLRNIIPHFLRIFKQCPGLLGPQFPVALAVLSLARTELDFYYLHRAEIPRKNGLYFSGWAAQKRHEPSEYHDPKIVVLIGLSEQLRHLCQKHANVVSEYYALFLKDVRLKEAQENRACLSALKICSDDFEQALEVMGTATADADLSKLRAAWYRCASKINDGWNPPPKYKSQVRLLQVIMDIAIRQSRYVDMQAQVHSQLSSLRSLWWNKHGLLEDFQVTTLNDNNQRNIDPSLAVDGVRLFHTAVENSHPLVGEDRQAIGQESVQAARYLLKLISARLAKAVSVNYEMERQLHSPSPNRDRHAENQEEEDRMLDAARQQVLYTMSDANNYLCRLARSFILHPSIVVYHTEFIPRLFLREVLSEHFKRFILGTKGSMGVVRRHVEDPEAMFRSLCDFVNVLGKACSLAGIQATSLVREVLREQVGSVGASIDARSSVMLSDGSTLVSELSTTFQHYLTATNGAVDDNRRLSTYCPIYDGFVLLGVRGKRGRKQRYLQSKYSTHGLSNLMGLIGPTGVRFLQANLVQTMFKKHARRIIEIVHRNRERIPQLEILISTNPRQALEVASEMELLNEFLRSLGCISVLLAFRAMLYSALARAGEKTPIIQKLCKLATRDVEFEFSSERMDLVGQASGVEPVADYLMQDALAEVRASVLKSAQRSPALECLGKSIAVLAAAAYTCGDFWNYKVIYETNLGIFNNNAHLFGPTLMKLVYDLTTLEQTGAGKGPGSGAAGGKVRTRPLAAHVMKQHVEISANLLMALKRRQEDRAESRLPLQLMIYALQMTVSASKKLVDQSFFEEIMPYKYVHFCWTEIVRGRRGHDASWYRTKDPHELEYFES